MKSMCSKNAISGVFLVIIILKESVSEKRSTMYFGILKFWGKKHYVCRDFRDRGGEEEGGVTLLAAEGGRKKSTLNGAVVMH